MGFICTHQVLLGKEEFRELCLFFTIRNTMNTKNIQLGYYLAGLIEGDGNIWTPNKFISSNGRKYNPQISFSFDIRDKALFELLKENFNSGYLCKQKDKNAGIFRINETNTIITIINLINGKFRTPKIMHLHRAIDQINLKHGTEIDKFPVDKCELSTNAWLAGFTDADGNFHISLEGPYGLNGSLSKGRVKCSFTIVQNMIYKPTGESCIPFMTEIANLFECKLNYRKYNALVFIVGANSKHCLVRNYFDKYPLMSSKYLNYKDYLKGLDYLGRSLTIKEISEIQTIKNSMNNKRIFYNWDHLKSFYK